MEQVGLVAIAAQVALLDQIGPVVLAAPFDWLDQIAPVGQVVQTVPLALRMATVAVACLDIGADYWQVYSVEWYQNIVAAACPETIVAAPPLDMIAVVVAYSPRTAAVAVVTADTVDKVDRVEWIDRVKMMTEREIEIVPALRACYSRQDMGLAAVQADLAAQFYPRLRVRWE